MKSFLYSRRTFISALAVIAIMVVGIKNGQDVSMALASVAIGLSAANAHEASSVAKQDIK